MGRSDTMNRLALATVWVLVGGQASRAAERPGVVDAAPAEGRCVEHNGKFLVGYQATIPGTDVTFWMEPVAGGRVELPVPEGAAPTVVELAPYWIARTEVTWAEYRQYMNLCDVFERFNDAGVRPVTEANEADAVTAPSKLYDPGFTFDSGEAPDLPAVSMTQYAAKQYTKWLSLLTGDFYRLPSEAEWVHACRAGRDAVAATDETAWHEGNSDRAAHPVASKEPNPWGLYDTLGNASEWVLDSHDAEPLEDPDGPLGEPPVRWPTKLFPRVLKGGSAYLPIDKATCTARRASDDDLWRDYDPNVPKSPWWFAYDDAQDVGFRIVRPYAAPPAERKSKYWEADVRRVQQVADFRIDEEGRGERGLVDPALPAAIERHAR
ncbi:SUMF1/EgtB/PvdO family nonheme iron enzyme [Botrimarina sp.]|uniref:formylglycine-generating enzyme family protein n=1 Tax=Botrimarina sp. TaxID=2795802 RepID=UPI0032ED6708